MADRRPSVISSTLKKPLIASLIIILMVLIAGFAGNFYLDRQDSYRYGKYLDFATSLRTLSQEISKNASAATRGQKDVFPVLAENKSEFSSYLGRLMRGDPTLKLPASSLDAQRELAHRLDARIWDAWDEEIKADAEAGRLDPLLAEVESDIANGRVKPLDEVLDNS